MIELTHLVKEFGDLTAKFVRDITGKDDYEFGECARASRDGHGDGRTWRRTLSRLLTRSRRGFRVRIH